MQRQPRKGSGEVSVRRAPATTIEARENQMISLAVDLTEKQLREGTASAQVITHYLKLGTAVHQMEKEKLRNETELIKARVRDQASNARTEELLERALEAMTEYKGNTHQEPDDDY